MSRFKRKSMDRKVFDTTLLCLLVILIFLIFNGLISFAHTQTTGATIDPGEIAGNSENLTNSSSELPSDFDGSSENLVSSTDPNASTDSTSIITSEDSTSSQQKPMYIGKTKITPEQVLACLPSGLAEIFSQLEDDDWNEYEQVLARLGKVMDMSNSTAMTEDQINLLCTVLSNEAIDQQSFEDSNQDLLKAYRSATLTRLQTSEKNRYSEDEYNNLKNASQQFAVTYKGGDASSPEQIVLYDQTFKLKHPSIIYNETLMISLDDAYQFIDATMTSAKDKKIFTIQSDGIRLELQPGSDAANINDKSTSMGSAMLYTNGSYYIPVEFFASTYNVSYIYLPDEKVVVMYQNLNQLQNGLVANTLIKS